MACNNLGNFSIGTTSTDLCYSALTSVIYGNDLITGTTVYADSGCTISINNSYFSDGILIYQTNLSGSITTITNCSCSQFQCIVNDLTYEDTYEYNGTYGSYNYFRGQLTNYFIFYSTGENRWCLAQNLGDPCDQFGPYGSTSNCPDFDSSVCISGPCITTTTTTNPCANFEFEAIFDCYVPPTPSVTPSFTPTPTLTPTPSSTELCGGRSMTVLLEKFTPTPTKTPTQTPSSTPIVTRPCNFSGEVIFNSINEIIQCANSKKFRDCFTGLEYFTTDMVLVSGSTSPKEGYVYNATINGVNYCVVFEGLFENISGVDNIVLTNEVGSANQGSCLVCTPETPDPILECVVINSECGNVNVSPGSFINGKLSYSWVFPNFQQYSYEIYWDSINGRWVCKETSSNQIGAYLYIDSELPIGSQLEWDYQNTLFSSTDCIEQLAGFFTTLLSVPCPTATPTPTPTPSPTPCIEYQYEISNNSPSKISVQYTTCAQGPTSISMNGYTSTIICSSTFPTSQSQNLQVNQRPFVC
ncbi:MAG: hypothetical protein EBU90_09310 [Proteobacteria bacterium]|nr:hypothetical protein [Pseudomonadota bacterium]